MDRELSHEELQELTGAYALDAVEPDEREAMELHLLECPRCRAEVAEYREVAAFLAHNGYTAPEGLWDRIAGALEEAPPPLDLAPVVALPQPRRSPGLRIVAAVAAAAAVVAAFLGVKVIDLDNKLDRFESEDALARAAFRAQQDPERRTIELADEDGNEGAELVLLPDGTGYVVSDRLDPLSPDRTWQLWAIVDGQAISMGVLGSDPGIASFQAAGEPSAFALSNEVVGGAPQPTAPLYSGNVT
jgi:hypothetical protein